ncbi:uncharacterized protein F5891DRAFT_1135561 [Suillus fuscotomentosus]|uniref:Uncharacterized protein n=1 Tax=Suillus fuscotomentosus TaxID=1912939 RepID=A0AAD4EMQ9_9AGAM|nr:uncharacterized protein F5891DRAFT_1135561 [Suillus fuscotomentosus]KAG1907833.1 hypothetical protein F5891DRAFT_1135561 [Suillus fuscotomentosus]
MGFLKKFFSIGSKKSKRQELAHHDLESLASIPKHLQPTREEDAEVAVSRLLRSSSARFPVESALNYASLPPLPHPINDVLPAPNASTATLGSVSKRSSYTVTVHGRTVHSRTEFPNAYPPMDSFATPRRNLNDSPRRRSKSVPITPRDQNRLLRLRQDPSVASLLNVYDDNGCLDSHVFSNTPPVAGGRGPLRRRRTGSTFRQLLTNPSGPELYDNSDIEWAESVLCETNDNSCASSLELKTPREPLFMSSHLNHAHHNITLSTEGDTSVPNQPTFSSLDVELSASTETTCHVNSPYGNPMSHQRASQIFGFLADRKKVSEERPSKLPTRKVTPPLHIMLDLASNNVQPPLSDTHSPESTHAETTSQLVFPSSQFMHVAPALDELPHHIVHSESEPVIINHTGRSSSSGQSSQGPRGPRAFTKIPSRSKSNPSPWLQDDLQPLPGIKAESTSSRPAFGEKLNGDVRYPGFTAVVSGDAASLIPASSRPRSSQRSKIIDRNHNSQVPIFACNGSLHDAFANVPSLAKDKSQVEVFSSAHMPWHDKENDMVSQLPQPKTPLRPLGFRPPYLQDKPSPASSSELSPTGKQIMTNLRYQRMQARQKERQTGRLGSSHSRIRY